MYFVNVTDDIYSGNLNPSQPFIVGSRVNTQNDQYNQVLGVSNSMCALLMTGKAKSCHRLKLSVKLISFGLHT